MKKITLLFLTFLAFSISNAQTTCNTAIPVSAGPTTVPMLTGTEVPDPICAANGAGATVGEWYSYTPTADAVVNITTNLPANAGGDTRLHVYTGACGALVCYAGNDDVDVGGGNYLSDATFAVTAGTTYIIAWDDRWDNGGFVFELTETAVDCSTSSTYSYDFADVNPFIACYQIEDANADGTSWGYNNGNDFDGDMVNDGVGLIFPPNPTVEKDDWLYLPVFNGVANADYELTVVYNVFDNPVAGNESFELVALDAPSSGAAMQTVIGTYTGITQSGAGVPDLFPNAYTSTATYTPVADGDFYFGIHVTTPQATSAIFTLFSVAVNETLGIDDFEANAFSHNYNKTLKTLNLESSTMPMTGIEVYSILGQSVMAKTLSDTTAALDVSSLTDGVYLAKVNINGNSKTIKFVKN